MHLIYSAISQNNAAIIQNNHSDKEWLLRYFAYQNTCEKYGQDIAAIQKYIPGWMPALPARYNKVL